MKESNEIIVIVQSFDERMKMIGILAHCGYEVTVNIIKDQITTTPTWYYVVAHKLA